MMNKDVISITESWLSNKWLQRYRKPFLHPVADFCWPALRATGCRHRSVRRPLSVVVVDTVRPLQSVGNTLSVVLTTPVASVYKVM